MDGRGGPIGGVSRGLMMWGSVCEVTGASTPHTHLPQKRSRFEKVGLVLASRWSIRTGRRIGQTEKRQQNDTRSNNLFSCIIGVGLALSQES